MSYRNVVLISLIAIYGFSCKKFLSTKSDQNLSTPETLEDVAAMLKSPSLYTGMNLINGCSDEYYLDFTDWQAAMELQQKGYVWDPQLDDPDDWNTQYNTVLYANTALFNLENISSEDQQQKWNEIKGTALFFRALSFYQIAQLYAPQYNAATAAGDLGIPLRLTVDFNQPSERASLKETYDRVIGDLQTALSLVSDKLPSTKASKGQPGKPAILALLARVYLQMGDYVKAKENADACLKLYNVLLDFNTAAVDPASEVPIQPFNEEMIFYTSSFNTQNSYPEAKIDSVLYDSYHVNDLRKTVYFKQNPDGISYRFKASYNGGPSDLFNGLATDEVYLIRAECNARLGNANAAIEDLNQLLVKRWKSNSFTPITTATPQEALVVVLQERKKELVYRGIRWSDLRRLNKNTEFVTTIKRVLNGEVYSLTPNDLRYTLLIPQSVMNVTNIKQNPR